MIRLVMEPTPNVAVAVAVTLHSRDRFIITPTWEGKELSLTSAAWIRLIFLNSFSDRVRHLANQVEEPAAIFTKCSFHLMKQCMAQKKLPLSMASRKISKSRQAYKTGHAYVLMILMSWFV